MVAAPAADPAGDMVVAERRVDLPARAGVAKAELEAPAAQVAGRAEPAAELVVVREGERQEPVAGHERRGIRMLILTITTTR